MLKRQLTLKEGVPLALGSILGSGVLFLPSLTYAVSGSYTIWVWILTTLFCLPLLFIFTNMVKAVPNESGIEGFVSLGLGKNIGASIPIIFLGTVAIGMPASALIVGDYVRHFLSGGILLQITTAFVIVSAGMATNLLGIRIGASIQMLVTALILIIGFSLVFFVPTMKLDRAALSFSPHLVKPLLQGIVIAFWAYAGFENLTFMAGEFKNPVRDFKLSMVISLFLCGFLYLLLSEACASNIPQNEVNAVSGLYQLAEKMQRTSIFTALVTIFAFFSVLINFNSWIWGISRLIYSSANQRKFFPYFSVLNKKFVPSRAIWLLGGVFFLVIVIVGFFPNFIQSILILVSTNFVFIYLLCLMSFVFFKKTGFLRILSIALNILLIIVFLSTKWIVIYPLLLFSIGIIGVKFFNKAQIVEKDLTA
jgi:amino acid efflux transporter